MLFKNKGMERYGDKFSYTYLFDATPIRKRQLKTLAFSKKEREFDPDYDDTGHAIWGFASGVGLIGAVVFFAYGACTGEIVPFEWGAALTGSAAPGLYNLTERVTRTRRYDKTEAKVDPRKFSVAIISGRDYGTTSDSPAFTALLETSFGETLKSLLFKHVIEKRKDLKGYVKYITENPDNEIFPKIKPRLDEYLAATAGIDSVLLENILPAEKIEKTKAMLKQYAEKVAGLMQSDLDEHGAGLTAAAEMKLQNAEIQLEVATREFEFKAGIMPDLPRVE